MDYSDPDINYDENGICNHCKKYDEEVNKEFLEEKRRRKD